MAMLYKSSHRGRALYDAATEPPRRQAAWRWVVQRAHRQHSPTWDQCEAGGQRSLQAQHTLLQYRVTFGTLRVYAHSPSVQWRTTQEREAVMAYRGQGKRRRKAQIHYDEYTRSMKRVRCHVTWSKDSTSMCRISGDSDWLWIIEVYLGVRHECMQVITPTTHIPTTLTLLHQRIQLQLELAPQPGV